MRPLSSQAPLLTPHSSSSLHSCWHESDATLRTDGIHAGDNTRPGSNTPETKSEATKILKFRYAKAAIDKHQMDQAIIFCRTKLDCDNLERYLLEAGW
jgi:ATP-dependent RNA helicase DDX1